MRILITLLLTAIFCTCGRAQVGTGVDAEYASWCMVDSVGPGNVKRFTRLVNIATLEGLDIDPVAGIAYNVVGTLFTCEAYDLSVLSSGSDPATEIYPNCQCVYTIDQEQHTVSQIIGGAQQEFEVLYDEFVTRKCDGQEVATEIYRQPLTKTISVPSQMDQKLTVGFMNGQLAACRRERSSSQSGPFCGRFPSEFSHLTR